MAQFDIANFSSGTTGSGDLNNTTSPITITLDTGSLPVKTNGFPVVIYDAATYPNPADDPDVEIAMVTASDGSEITMTRASAVEHAGVATVARNWTAEDVDQIYSDMVSNPMTTAADRIKGGADGAFERQAEADWQSDVQAATGTTPDTPPATANAMDDEFEGASLDGKWSWVNQDAATATVGNGVCTLSSVGTSNNQVRLLVQTLPATPWEFTCKCQWFSDTDGNYSQVGLALYDSDDDKVISLQIDEDSKLTVIDWTDTTTFGSDEFVRVLRTFNSNLMPQYFRIANRLVGEPAVQTILFYWSANGVAWHLLHSRAANYFATPDKIGLFAGVNVSASYTVSGIFHWFRRTV